MMLNIFSCACWPFVFIKKMSVQIYLSFFKIRLCAFFYGVVRTLHVYFGFQGSSSHFLHGIP